MSSNRKSTSPTACHWLPCQINHDGIAPVSTYFCQEEVKMCEVNDEENLKQNIEAKYCSPDEGARGNTVSIGASFRGRGLLATEPSKLPPNILGCVMKIQKEDSNRDSPSRIEFTDTFDTITEWKHDFDLSRSRNQPQDGSVIQNLELLKIMQSVHKPIE
eukprot:CAMPEP_0184872618 /NCGR_PEP_ID=MMETSP0580-20130426/41395_1 /TAXON_ID=1118495 /ORGANISM="Dactyliosolen fragilissimus" /LENGTH=159 /DNA_ID=CAMNT_0027375449 /DNA_START=74 /DNA_END=553 /DNA_ORIENTATION=-